MRWLGALVLVLGLSGCGADRWYPTVETVPAASETSGAGQAVGTEPDASDDDADPRTDAVPVEAAQALPTATYDESGGLVIRVEDAVLLAVANNRDLRVRRFDPTIAATFEDIERGVYDPEVFARASLARDETQVLGADIETDETELTLGLRQALPSGTALELRAEQTDTELTGAADVSESRIGLTVTQALLRGFGPAVNMAQIRQAAIEADISRAELRAFAEAVVAETEIAYWRLVQAGERIAIVDESLRVAERQRDDTLARIAVGGAARSDAAATRSEVARRKQALIQARSERAGSGLRLLRLVTPFDRLDFDRKVTLTTDAAISPGELGTLGERIALSQTKRPELQEARMRFEQRRLEVVRTRNGLLPRLDFFVELASSGVGGSVGQAWQDLDGDRVELEVGLDFSYRLGDRSAAARTVA
nr:TolC family protein [Planctomycetota bacterium]